MVDRLPESWDELRKYLRPCWARLTRSLARWRDHRDACDYDQIFEMHSWQACLKWNREIPLRAWITFVCKRRWSNFQKEHDTRYGQANKLSPDDVEDIGHDTVLDKLVAMESLEKFKDFWESGDVGDDKIKALKYRHSKFKEATTKSKKEMKTCPCGRPSQVAGLCGTHYRLLVSRRML